VPAVRADGPGLNRIFRPYPRVLPHALGAGIEPDSEAIECFRTMNLSFHDREVHTEDEWRLFLEKVRRRVSRRVGAVRGWADGSVTPSHRRQPRGGRVMQSSFPRPSGLRGGVKSSWRQGVAPAGSLHPRSQRCWGAGRPAAPVGLSAPGTPECGGHFSLPRTSALTVERSTGPVTCRSAG